MQEQVIDTLQITQAERIIDKYSEQISEAFSKGVEKITPVAEEGWKLAVEYQKAVGIAEFTKAFGALLIVLLIFYVQRYANKKMTEPDNNEWEGFDIACYIFGGILQICLLFYIFSCIVDGVLHIKAPEWYALNAIMNMFN